MNNYLKYGKSNYVVKPYIDVNDDTKIWKNSNEIVSQVNELINKDSNKKLIIAFDYYYGVDEEFIEKNIIKKLNISLKTNTSDFKKSEEETKKMLNYWLTDDRIFGKMVYMPLVDFFDQVKLNKFNNSTNNNTELIYGVGASLFKKADIIFYFDINRWEIQKKQRSGQDNWNAKNFSEDQKTKYKRSYFIEWRSMDEHKKSIFNDINYWVDGSGKENFQMIEAEKYRFELSKLTNKPFRVEPFFDPGVWGGQWMKQVMNLDKNEKNYAWCFDFVVEENSINFKIGNILFNTPAINTVLFKPELFLGEKVYSRFGAEWPIRSDLLDCMEGQNLSLHVHPLTEFAFKNYGINYTQDETYYILDGKENQSVYLGLKNNVKKQELKQDLLIANSGKNEFNVEKYVNKFKSNIHDHFIIPAGTPHCAGKDTMVLEISANPYIFTLRMWDWGRVDFDGKPRSIKIDEAVENIQIKFDTKYTNEKLCAKPIVVQKNDDYLMENTAYHEREFFRTDRFTFKDQIHLENDGNFSLIHLVEGYSVLIYSENNEFEEFELHYAEVVALPAGVRNYNIKNNSNFNKEIKILKSYVKF